MIIYIYFFDYIFLCGDVTVGIFSYYIIFALSLLSLFIIFFKIYSLTEILLLTLVLGHPYSFTVASDNSSS